MTVARPTSPSVSTVFTQHKDNFISLLFYLSFSFIVLVVLSLSLKPSALLRLVLSLGCRSANDTRIESA